MIDIKQWNELWLQGITALLYFMCLAVVFFAYFLLHYMSKGEPKEDEWKGIHAYLISIFNAIFFGIGLYLFVVVIKNNRVLIFPLLLHIVAYSTFLAFFHYSVRVKKKLPEIRWRIYFGLLLLLTSTLLAVVPFLPYIHAGILALLLLPAYLIAFETYERDLYYNPISGNRFIDSIIKGNVLAFFTLVLAMGISILIYNYSLHEPRGIDLPDPTNPIWYILAVIVALLTRFYLYINW